MMLRNAATAAAACAGLMLAAGTAQAFDRGCGGHAVACYEKVRTPDVYATVARKVVVRPASREVVETPAIYGRRASRVVVDPARVHAVREPALYTTRLKRVLIRPARVSYEQVPATVRTVRERVQVSDGGYRWEHRRSLFGRERLCKVRGRPVYKTVTREVVVRPAERIRHVAPAVYEHVPERILVREARTRKVYTPAVTAIVHKNVLLKPAERHVIHRPAIVGTEHERVRVREGGYAWRATHHGRRSLLGHVLDR